MAPMQNAAGTDDDPAGQDFVPAALAELLEVFGPGGVAQIIEALADDVPLQARRFRDAAAAGDLPALRRIVHSLRGAILHFGAEALAELCRRAEAACAAGEPAAVDLGAEVLRRYAALVGRLVREAGERRP